MADALPETTAHTTLKKLTLQWAGEQGYHICGFEIRLPHSNYRADAVAYRRATQRLPLPGDTATRRLNRISKLSDEHSAVQLSSKIFVVVTQFL